MPMPLPIHKTNSKMVSDEAFLQNSMQNPTELVSIHTHRLYRVRMMKMPASHSI